MHILYIVLKNKIGIGKNCEWQVTQKWPENVQLLHLCMWPFSGGGQSPLSHSTPVSSLTCCLKSSNSGFERMTFAELLHDDISRCLTKYPVMIYEYYRYT